MVRGSRNFKSRGLLGSSAARALIAGIFALMGGFLVTNETPQTNSAEFFTVDHIADGDTLTVRSGQNNKTKERVRLLGIDAPEASDNEKAARDAARARVSITNIIKHGATATAFMRKKLAPGDSVKIEFDQQRRDRFGRLLGYVYLKNGKMLNLEMIDNGFAIPMNIAPNNRYKGEFARAAKEAKRLGRGLWADGSLSMRR